MPEQSRGEGCPWDQRFEEVWGDLQKQLGRIPPANLDSIFQGLAELFKRKTFHEPVQDCVNQNWMARYDGVRETLNKLRDQRQHVRRACGTFTIDVYEALIAELSSYAMATSLLLGKAPFPINASGQVQIEPPGIAVACEQRRLHIKNLLCHLLDAKEAPVFQDAFKFEYLQTFAEKKNLIHRTTAELEKASKAIQPLGPGDKQPDWSISNWDFDRIMYYIYRESHDTCVLNQEMQNTTKELEKVRAKGEGASFMPLHYSLGPIKAAICSTNKEELSDHRQELSNLMDSIRSYVETANADKGGQLRSTLLEINQFLPKG